MKPWYQNPWIIGIATTTAVLWGASALSAPSPTQPINPVQETSYSVQQTVKETPVVPKAVERKAPAKPSSKQEQCNPNYSGCLRADASDYDCAKGTGNGPYYTGRVQVLGYDEYGLDRDGDGVGCE